MPVIGQGTVCVYLFNDINGNAIAEDGETSIGGGEISITSDAGDFSQTAPTTADDNPVCFENINEGNYTISIAIPDGYNATTAQNYKVTLKAGMLPLSILGPRPVLISPLKAVITAASRFCWLWWEGLS